MVVCSQLLTRGLRCPFAAAPRLLQLPRFDSNSSAHLQPIEAAGRILPVKSIRDERSAPAGVPIWHDPQNWRESSNSQYSSDAWPAKCAAGFALWWIAGDDHRGEQEQTATGDTARIFAKERFASRAPVFIFRCIAEISKRMYYCCTASVPCSNCPGQSHGGPRVCLDAWPLSLLNDEGLPAFVIADQSPGKGIGTDGIAVSTHRRTIDINDVHDVFALSHSEICIAASWKGEPLLLLVQVQVKDNTGQDQLRAVVRRLRGFGACGAGPARKGSRMRLSAQPQTVTKLSQFDGYFL